MRYTRDQAANYKFPFGKHQGRSLLSISSDIGGMKYLIELHLQSAIEACPIHLLHDFKIALWVFIHTVDTDDRHDPCQRRRKWRR